MKIKRPNKKRLQHIAERVLNGTATDAERLFLDEYYNLFDSEKNSANNPGAAENHDVFKAVQQRLVFTLNNSNTDKKLSFYISRVAAAIMVLALAAIVLHTLNKKQKPVIAQVKNKTAPIVHASNKATLTLSNGATIVLGDKSSGSLAKQGQVKIAEKSNGEIVYSGQNPDEQSLANQFNTLSTPRGGIFQVTLPDGTKVWLNSSTTLKYPVAFSGAERKVELDGEAYFEVAHNQDMPFLVVSKTQTVKVLGTHFNINAYQDEEYTKTTLLQGSVRVSLPDQIKPVLLVPGQQSVAKTTGIKVRKVDPDNTMAWKNGLFQFDNEEIHSIMKKISRWYDVDIAYEKGIEDMRFGGLVSRYADISQVLHKLELTNTIHFKIEGRRILVMK